MGAHQALWININEKMLLDFWQDEIIPPIVENLCLTDISTIKIFNDTIHKRFVKNDINQKIHYIRVQASYSLPTNLAQAFKKLDELITRLLHAADEKYKRKITGHVK